MLYVDWVDDRTPNKTANKGWLLGFVSQPNLLAVGGRGSRWPMEGGDEAKVVGGVQFWILWGGFGEDQVTVLDS